MLPGAYHQIAGRSPVAWAQRRQGSFKGKYLSATCMRISEEDKAKSIRPHAEMNYQQNTEFTLHMNSMNISISMYAGQTLRSLPYIVPYKRYTSDTI